jgi:hypothetical protein
MGRLPHSFLFVKHRPEELRATYFPSNKEKIDRPKENDCKKLLKPIISATFFGKTMV